MERIQRIKYNQELVRHKTALEKQAEMLNIGIKDMQKSCDHLYVTIGNNPEYITKCLFCSKEIVGKVSSDLRLIDAVTYRRDLYSDGYNREQRYRRMSSLQELALSYLEENENLTDEELIKLMSKEIEEDEFKNKALEKRLDIDFL